MTIDARNFKVTGQWAKGADIDIPPIPITGRAYRKINMTQADAESGQAYDVIWESARNNQMNYEVSGIAVQTSKYGVVPWTPLEDYPVGAIQMGTDEIPYRCMKPHGPNTPDPDNPGLMVGPKDPTDPANVGPESYWMTLAAYLIAGGAGGSYTPIPNTLALRNNIGRTQVNDPIEDLDAANKRWVLNEIGGGGGLNVEQPVITAPPEGTVIQSLGVAVTVTEIALAGGGTPEPDQTQIRALREDGRTVIGTVTTAYTTAPSITVDEASIGQGVEILVRHHDEVFGWSPWSDRLKVSIASVVQLPAKVTYPARYATDIPPVGLTVTLDGGKWSDGSAYAGSQTSLVVRSVADDAEVYSTGWIGYTTTVDIPAGVLLPSTSYWIAARHRASSAPTSNPQALLDSPALDIDNPAASVFTTKTPSAPSITDMQYAFPSLMKSGTQATGRIWGATSTDGGDVTYDIASIGPGLSFSQTSGIVDNQDVIVGASTELPAQATTFQIVAKSSYGGVAEPVTVRLTLVAQLEWLFTASQGWTPPVQGYYKLEAGGGGAGGDYGRDSGGNYPQAGGGGGGGGCAIKNRYLLNRQNYNVTVGAGGIGANGSSVFTASPGGVSSFDSIITATGGQIAYFAKISQTSTIVVSKGGAGGVGAGGDVNRTGGKGGDEYFGNLSVPFYGGGGGGGAGPNNGGAGGDNYGTAGASGGESGGVNGGGGAGPTGGKGGIAGIGGAGGGGGCGQYSYAMQLYAGGNGGRGCVRVTLLEIA